MHFEHSSAAKRISEVATQLWLDNKWDCVGKFIAVNLGNGMTNKDLYPSVKDAARFNDPYKHFFLKLHPQGIGECEAEILLRFHRDARANGFPQADPQERNGGRTLIPRIGNREIISQIRAFRKG